MFSGRYINFTGYFNFTMVYHAFSKVDPGKILRPLVSANPASDPNEMS